MIEFEKGKLGVLRTIATIALAFSLCGCLGGPSNPGLDRRATAIDPAQATDAYWYAKPGIVSVDSLDYDRIWNACQNEALARLFDLDRLDYREGLMTTEPMISQQWFEPWRADCLTAYDTAQSSIQNIRRTIRFEFSKTTDSGWRMVPKVLVERRANREDRVTSVTQYREAVGGTEITNTFLLQSEAAHGKDIPYLYWYAIGRDPVLEHAIAEDVRRALASQVAANQ